MKRSLPLNAVRVFELAAQHLSFTKAGEELSLTAAAVSAQVKLLESYLGTALFVRSNNRLSLTSAGDAKGVRMMCELATCIFPSAIKANVQACSCIGGND